MLFPEMPRTPANHSTATSVKKPVAPQHHQQPGKKWLGQLESLD